MTGASRGLGLGIARRLVAPGHDVIAVARVAPELSGAVNLAADVTSPDDVARIVEAAQGDIALLVNNAAAPPVMDTLQELTPERFRLGFDVDVGGTLALTQAAAPHLRGGTVVNLIAARGGTSPGAAHLSVSPSQAALTALTRCLATILAPDDIAVHGLQPAITPAGGTGTIAAPVLGIEFGKRYLTADEVGEAVVRLAGERASGIWTVGTGGVELGVALAEPAGGLIR